MSQECSVEDSTCTNLNQNQLEVSISHTPRLGQFAIGTLIRASVRKIIEFIYDLVSAILSGGSKYISKKYHFNSNSNIFTSLIII